MREENDTALLTPVFDRVGRHYCIFFALLLALSVAACGEATPTPFPAATDAPEVTPTATITPTPVPLTRYENAEGAFALELPVTWMVEEKGLTPLGEYYQLGPAPVGPGPDSSALFIARLDGMTAADAAESLLCGNGCAEAITLEETTVGGRQAVRALLDAGNAPLEWFFVEHLNHLIFFTLHDPETLATRAELVDSFTFLEPTPTPTATRPAPTPEPTATASAPVERWDAWQPAIIEDAGLSFERPEEWVVVREGTPREWAPIAGSLLRLGFTWQPLAPDQDLQLLLPAGVEIRATTPLTLTWEGELNEAFSRGARFTVQNGTEWEEHAVFQLGLRGYDLYLRGPTTGSLDTLEPVLAHALATVDVSAPQLALEDPVEATVLWFRALLADQTGNVARTYMTPELRAQVPQGTSAQTLLALEERIALFNVSRLSGNQQETVVEAEITLADGSTVRRRMTLVRDPAAGWQVNAVVNPEGA